MLTSKRVYCYQALNDEIIARKHRSKELHMTARRLSRESSFSEDYTAVDDLDALRQQAETLAKRSADRLSQLEQAVPLAEHFYGTRDALFVFFDQLDKELAVQMTQGDSPDQSRARREMIQVSLIDLFKDCSSVDAVQIL